MSSPSPVVVMLSLLFFASSARGAETAQFEPLFDGKSLEGWQGATEGYLVEDGMLVCKEGAEGNLLTEEEFSDFVIRFEFKLSPGANNGLAIRSPREGNAAYAGMELQIIDNDTKKYGELLDYQYHGSMYGVAPAERGHQKPAGEWNAQEVSCIGRNVKVALNGVEILNVDLDDFAPDGTTVDHTPHPGLTRKSGHVGFLSHGDKVWLRNIEIKDLSEKDIH